MMTRDPDPIQTPAERLADHTDTRLADLYHRCGVLQAGDDDVFSRDEVLRLMRASYWYGVVDKGADPAATSRAADAALGERRPAPAI